MMRNYFGITYEWIRAEDDTSRAAQLFRYGQILVGHKSYQVTPHHIEYWLKEEFIREREAE